MWCTRWFIPLLILPLPSSPPYFLILFLISMIIHARPCFYCIILLTALFLSSCYWQPVPLDSSLSSSWATNATFAAVLTAALSSSVTAPLPAVIRLADRCWCDVSSSRLFEPFDIARWERTSIEQLKEEIERDAASAEQLSSAVRESDLSNEGGRNPSATNGTGSSIVESQNSISVPPSHTSVLSTSPQPSSVNTPAEKSSTHQIPAEQNGPPVVPHVDLPLFRRKYDLRPYGLSMILDFGWIREE
ncbi:hypothetical protein F5888DRAFT_1686973 [Russula emetica]|nr:hypothetical protein F5888DRAFT_1686973 [Russula emetica]